MAGIAAAAGPITFADFMRAALYDPRAGYYRRRPGPVGATGDYYTSPTAHPVFGALIARQLRQMWFLMDRPALFTVRELGAGKGELAEAITEFSRAVAPDFAEALDYQTFEVDTVPEGMFRGCLLSNELFDALPFHRVQRDAALLQELYVAVEDGRLVERPGPLSSQELSSYLDTLGVEIPQGSQAEIGLEAAAFMASLAAQLEQGYALTVDYGYLAEELFGQPRPHGTALSYYRHTYSDDLLAHPGEQDITAHVDFSGLALAGERQGLLAVELIRQRAFLLNLGFAAYEEALQRANLSERAREQNRFAARTLIDARGLGRFGVLVQAKHAPFHDPETGASLLAGLKGGEADGLDFEQYLPLHGPRHVPLLDAVQPVQPEMRWEDFLPDGAVVDWSRTPEQKD